MIIQGTNKPILIGFCEDMEWLEFIEIGLYDKNKKPLKHWNKDSVIINGSIIECPQTQEETMEYTAGICEILVKWIGVDGHTEFAEKINDRIVLWNDDTVMGVVEDV